MGNHRLEQSHRQSLSQGWHRENIRKCLKIGHVVTFLASTPAKAAVAAVDPAAYGDDEFSVVGAEVYLHTPAGYGRSKLHNAFWERKLGTTATTRNWNTVLALAELTAKR